MTQPSTTMQIPLTRPHLGPEEAAAVQEVMASGWLVQGKRVAALEAAPGGKHSHHLSATISGVTEEA